MICLLIFTESPALSENQQLAASMLECRGRIQREGEVIHVVADQLTDLTPLLRPDPDAISPHVHHRVN